MNALAAELLDRFRVHGRPARIVDIFDGFRPQWAVAAAVLLRGAGYLELVDEKRGDEVYGVAPVDPGERGRRLAPGVSPGAAGAPCAWVRRPSMANQSLRKVATLQGKQQVKKLVEASPTQQAQASVGSA